MSATETATPSMPVKLPRSALFSRYEAIFESVSQEHIPEAESSPQQQNEQNNTGLQDLF